MRSTDSRSVRVEAHSLKHDPLSVVAHVLPDVGQRLESLALYLLVCAFWALVVYTAVTSALQ